MANSRSNRSNNSNSGDKPSKTRTPKPTSTPTLAPQQQQQSANSSSNLQQQQQHQQQHHHHADSDDLVRIDDLPVETLRKYREVHKLEHQISSALSHSGYLLRNNNTSIAKRTFTAKHSNRVSKHELAAVVKRNFNQQTVRESEVIVDFIYSVNKQGT